MVAVESYLAILVIFTDRLASLIAFRLRWISDETQPRWTNMVVPEVLGGVNPIVRFPSQCRPYGAIFR